MQFKFPSSAAALLFLSDKRARKKMIAEVVAAMRDGATAQLQAALSERPAAVDRQEQP